MLTCRKRWLLFPPESSLGRLQTRLPYEESSVYIDMNPLLIKQFQVQFFVVLVFHLYLFVQVIFSSSNDNLCNRIQPRISMCSMLLSNLAIYSLFLNIGGILFHHWTV
jgi:hypothetical protein